MELNEYGRRVWKHKTNKILFLDKPYSWSDRLFLLDETESRQIVDSFLASTFDFSAWEPMTKEEYTSVVKHFKEIYESKPESLIDLNIPRESVDDLVKELTHSLKEAKNYVPGWNKLLTKKIKAVLKKVKKHYGKK